MDGEKAKNTENKEPLRKHDSIKNSEKVDNKGDNKEEV